MSEPGRWIFLRGLMRDSRHWGSFPQAFQSAFPDDRIELLDLPGNGLRNHEHSPARVEAMTESIRQALRAGKRTPPHRILAMSLGAMVTVDWMMRYPGEVHAAVLINTSLRPFSRIHERLRPAAYWPMLRLLLANPDERTVEQTILELTSRHREETTRVVNNWVDWRRSHPVSRGNALRQLLAAARFRAPRAAPSMPILVLTSTEDGLVDTRCSQKLAEAWHCPIAVHPSAGHDLPLDAADWVIAQVKGWRDKTSAI